MSILKKFELMAKDKIIKIGIGLSENEIQNNKILRASINFIRKKGGKIFLFGTEKAAKQILNQKNYLEFKRDIILEEWGDPINRIFKFLNEKQIDAIVRGSFSSSSFLKNIKKKLILNRINRLALLETYNGFQFFYGPVGIDECNNKKKKIEFIEKALKLFEKIGLHPKISVLSGGRKSDLGRDAIVDNTIKDAEEIVNYFKKADLDIEISHDEILIEKAIKNNSTLIIAPDGISGNLIYRTLVHLGGGNAYGAIYLDTNHIIIDTSRVGKISEIEGAFLLARALAR
ncbi:MAG: methanogenesis marker protein Mmp4/MtxX [Promethearchaeota archaeon]